MFMSLLRPELAQHLATFFAPLLAIQWALA